MVPVFNIPSFKRWSCSWVPVSFRDKCRKKAYLTAAIYYYYYPLHHILLQLYYKFPLNSNHILKLFTAKLEMGLRHRVHIPAWVWTFLQFRFIQTQHLTLLLLKDGTICKVWMCIGVQQLRTITDTWDVPEMVATEMEFYFLSENWKVER